MMMINTLSSLTSVCGKIAAVTIPASMADLMQEKLAKLLSDAQNAHHDYETTELEGVFDEQWPQWYADFLMSNGFADLLAVEADMDQLASRLSEISQRHKAERIDESWADYTAHNLLEAYT